MKAGPEKALTADRPAQAERPVRALARVANAPAVHCFYPPQRHGPEPNEDEASGSFGIDLNHLLKLRLVVARHGEMDRARWWNTQGMLGRRGVVVLERGFPSTHFFAQARVVFAVARARCNELYSPPGATLSSPV